MRLDPAPSEPLVLAPARVHEAAGIGRRAFALFQAARHPGPLIWILAGHAAQLPMLRGLPDFLRRQLPFLQCFLLRFQCQHLLHRYRCLHQINLEPRSHRYFYSLVVWLG